MSNTKTVLGFIAGAAVGALAGILLAPDKGSETRRKIAGKAGGVTDSLKSAFNDFVEEIKETYSDVKDDEAELTSKLKSANHSFQEEVKASL
jgi:gas vesicle protein